jgi:ribosomal protein L27
MKNSDQAIGRGRGEDTTVYQLCDGNSTFKSHAKILRQVNEKRGAIVTEEYV